jgi:hypothetical protein
MNPSIEVHRLNWCPPVTGTMSLPTPAGTSADMPTAEPVLLAFRGMAEGRLSASSGDRGAPAIGFP